MLSNNSCLYLFLLFYFTSLLRLNSQVPIQNIPYSEIDPVTITDPVNWDSDDPAIWIHPTNRKLSLIIGTDKHENGALCAFDLSGKIVKRFSGLHRPNNVDVEYGFIHNGESIDIAVVTERYEQRIRVFKLPDLEPIDSGDLIVFNGDRERAPMGIAIYKRQKDDEFFIIVGSKKGPRDNYLSQYKLKSNTNGKLQFSLVREFGKFSGAKEIEAIAVDSDLGYVYYSDETVGVRKYHADPDVKDANVELALFADKGFKSSQEGISIYNVDDKTGYIIISDQQADKFWIFTREGSPGKPHDHQPIKIVKLQTKVSDGNEVTNLPLSFQYPAGLFVAMSDDKTFQYYSWKDIAGDDLRICGE